MPHFMTQFSYTPAAWKLMVQNPQDRESALRDLAAKMNAKVVCMYFTAGEYDGVGIIDAPDDETVNAMIFAVTGAGHVKATRTTRLYTMAEVLKSLNKAKAITYSGPK